MAKSQTVLVLSQTNHLQQVWEIPHGGIVVRIQLVEDVWDVSAESGGVAGSILRQIEEGLNAELKLSGLDGEPLRRRFPRAPGPGESQLPSGR
jgi:hypothetical protein